MNQPPRMPSAFDISNKYPGPAPYRLAPKKFKMPPPSFQMQPNPFTLPSFQMQDDFFSLPPHTLAKQPPIKTLKLSTEVQSTQLQSMIAAQLKAAAAQVRSRNTVTSKSTTYVLIRL